MHMIVLSFGLMFQQRQEKMQHCIVMLSLFICSVSWFTKDTLEQAVAELMFMLSLGLNKIGFSDITDQIEINRSKFRSRD